MAGREPGRALELLPSATLDWGRERGDTVDCSLSATPGSFDMCGGQLSYSLGAKWGITSSLTLDAVFNPDFSQIEADPAQLTVNNRFALYLDEKRPFFMEAKDIFASPLNVVYTRSIGQPDVALKLSGTTGGVRVGLLMASDPTPPDSVIDANFSPSESEHSDVRTLTAVGRAQMDMGEGVTAGAFVVERDYLRSSALALPSPRRASSLAGLSPRARP